MPHVTGAAVEVVSVAMSCVGFPPVMVVGLVVSTVVTPVPVMLRKTVCVDDALSELSVVTALPVVVLPFCG